MFYILCFDPELKFPPGDDNLHNRRAQSRHGKQDDLYNDLFSHLSIYVGEQDDPTEGGDHRCLQLAVTAAPQVEKSKMILIGLNPR